MANKRGLIKLSPWGYIWRECQMTKVAEIDH